MAACRIAVVLALVGGTAHLLTAAAFRRRAGALAADLEGAAAQEAGAAEMPAIVRSFARRAVPEGIAPRTIRLRQIAEMRSMPGSAWHPVTAEQIISVRKPGFLWLARMRAARLFPVRIIDAYVAGRGVLEARLFGSVRLARAEGAELDRGELMRYLAELAWAPHAILHNPHLSWREIEPCIVEVSAVGPGRCVRVRLIFEHGDIVRIEADDRPRAVGARFIPTRWDASYFDYRVLGNCRIPTRAEVSWTLDTGRFVCWRGEITSYSVI